MERTNSSSSISSVSSNATIRGASSSSNPQPSQSYIKQPSFNSSSAAHGSPGSGDTTDSASSASPGENLMNQAGASSRGNWSAPGQRPDQTNPSSPSADGAVPSTSAPQQQQQSRPTNPSFLRTVGSSTPQTQAADNSPQTPQSASGPGGQPFGNYRIPERVGGISTTGGGGGDAQSAGTGGHGGGNGALGANIQFTFTSNVPYPSQRESQSQPQSQSQTTQYNQTQNSSQNGRAQSPSPGGAPGGEPWGSPFPSLHLWPLNETFVMKMIALPRDQRIKIGRQTNVKTVPGERNGYFDSKVLSRMHAELWEEGGKIYIRDVKSSNGTFINGDRLSGEGIESEPFELKSEDMVEFGIDIVSEDNKSVLHHKVSAKAYCVFNVDDAGLSSRELTHYYPHDPRTSMGPARRIAGLPGPHSSNSLGPNGQVLTNNMLSAGGKIQGLNFDHLLHKLQMELQKSQDTGKELRGLTEAMEGIQETLSGAVAPEQNGSAEHHIPPQFRIPPAQAVSGGVPVVAMGDTTATIAALQAQLSTTQSILVSHKDRIKSLESLLQEHEAIKDEVMGMRRQMEESKHEIDLLLRASEEKAAEDAAEDAAASAAAESARDTEDSRSNRERGRSKTSDHVKQEEEEDITVGGRQSERSVDENADPAVPNRSPHLPGSRLLSPSLPSSRENDIIAQNNALGSRLDGLTVELDQALQLSRTLHDHHAEATSAVKALEEKVRILERDVAERTDAASKSNRAAEDRWEVWRIKFEDGWRKERESWNLERERLRGVVREWEEASRRAQEEEEERVMNGKLSDDEALLSDSDDDDDSESDEDDDRLLARTDWLGIGLSTSDEEPRLGGSLIGDLPRRSHSASPRSSRSGGKSGRHRRSRRSSSSRLDPAIRALRATAGEDAHYGGRQLDFDRKRDRFGTGAKTPRNGSPTTADQALGALRNKSARAERAKTITGRQPSRGVDSDGAHDGNTTEPPSGSKKSKIKSGLSKTASAVDVKRSGSEDGVPDANQEVDAEKENQREQTPVGETHSNSGESDETAHDVTGETKTGPGKEVPSPQEEAKQTINTANQSFLNQNQLPLAISIVVIGVGVWAVLNRAKD